jgi:predicted RNA-binding protein with RPS1 domain
MLFRGLHLVACASAIVGGSAFISTPLSSISHTNTIPLKGTDSTVLFSSVTTTTTDANSSVQSSIDNNSSKVKKFPQSSTTKNKSKNKSRNNQNSKKQRKVVVKNIPPKRKTKGRYNSKKNNRTFKPLKDLVLGSKVSGTVVDVCDFGAFVNIGYATRGSRAGTALLHISQIKNEKIKNIHDVIKVGDVIEGARVIGVDLKKGEVGLSLRSRRQKRKDFQSLKVGDEVEGKVDSLLSYGAFIDVGCDVNGLLHISRITGGAIENIRHHLNEGDPVSVHIIDIDADRKTMAVSMLDKKADLYLDRRMKQRMKKYYGASGAGKKEEDSASSTELDYFDQAIKELEEALRDREGEE